MNEARILKNLKHPNIPVIYDIEEDDEFSYIILEFLDGLTLKAYRLGQSNIREEIVIHFAIQICDLFQYIHAKETPILYLDLKPDNIILQDNILKLIDFGSAIFREESKARKATFGTKGFAAPEQYNQGILDERSDIYGIGNLMYFIVTKKYFDKNLSINKFCSKNLQTIIIKCLEYDPSNRYQNVLQLQKNLLELREKLLPSYKGKSTNSLNIAVAGSQNRIGTTHISLLITSFLNQFMDRALYIERNSNNLWNEITTYNSECGWSFGFGKVRNCLFQMEEIEYSHSWDGKPILINDFGVLKQDNIDEFLQADILLVVLGAKEWELAHSNRLIKDLLYCKNIFYLFNFASDMQFTELKRSMFKEVCIHVPYCPDPFDTNDSALVKKFIGQFFQEKHYEKKTITIKKHLWFKRSRQ